MKKKSVYFIVPILCLVLFGGYYWSFMQKFDAHQQEMVAIAKKAREDKLAAEDLDRQKAIKQAVDAAAQRKKENDERRARDLKMGDDKENAKLNSDKAEQEAQKLQREADKLTKDVAAEDKEIAELQDKQKKETQQLTFLADYVKQANENRANMANVIVKIQAADDAIAKQILLQAAKAKE